MNGVIYKILREKSILDYLEKKGHHPVRQLAGGKYSFLCPFPDHNETKPSFIVWTNAEYENFRCFGCLRNYNIIHLLSGLEGISYKDAVTRLGGDMEITIEEDVDLQMKLIDEQYKKSPFANSLRDMLISISKMGRYYLEWANYASSEKKIIESVFNSVDKDLSNSDFDKIEETYSLLPSFIDKRKQHLKSNGITFN